ncbi:TatD family hydrolase [Candidatus Gottesmanbacteria bacterium]|nr:TatD family hydrolase [Candidatus Gottesmanbacteria bacterium]
MYIDTHCHLQFSDYDSDRAMTIGNAKKAGVKKIICPGTDFLSSQKAIELAQKNPGVVYASVGFHPYEAQKNPNVSAVSRQLSAVSSLVAIGECGLDYHRYGDEKAEGKKSVQKRLFSDQLELALAYNLPAIMHCRDAYEDFFDVLDLLPSMPRGVIHCFSGGLADLRMAQKRNLFVGIDGNVTYSKHLQTTVPNIPLSMLLLETDSPYLTPIPHRGERNEPKYIPFIAKEIAKLQRVPVETVEEATTNSAKTLFAL